MYWYHNLSSDQQGKIDDFVLTLTNEWAFYCNIMPHIKKVRAKYDFPCEEMIRELAPNVKEVVEGTTSYIVFAWAKLPLTLELWKHYQEQVEMELYSDKSLEELGEEIVEHMEKATEHFKKVNDMLLSTKEEKNDVNDNDEYIVGDIDLCNRAQSNGIEVEMLGCSEWVAVKNLGFTAYKHKYRVKRELVAHLIDQEEDKIEEMETDLKEIKESFNNGHPVWWKYTDEKWCKAIKGKHTLGFYPECQYRLDNPNNPEVKQTEKETKPMKSIKIEQQVNIVVDGQESNAAKYTDDRIFGFISDMEKEIEKLNKIQNKPKKLEKELLRMEDEIKALVTYVDSRESK